MLNLTTGAAGRRRTAAAAGVALAAMLAPCLAVAQTTAAPQAGADGLSPGAVYVEADGVERQGDILHAFGRTDRVLARANGATIRADDVRYDLAGGGAQADGHIEAVSAAGDIAFASHIELDKDFKTGFAVDLATRLADGGTLMAATAVRRSPTVNQLNYAIFTPCPICDEKGEYKTPSISIQAQSVVQDEALRAILYRNAVFRVGGVPVFWLPVFAHPDPTVERASGFLVPTFNYDEGRGLSVEVPYLHVVSPSEDWLISPQFNTRVAPLLNLQWRRRFEDGLIVARGGYTYERNFGDFDLDGDGDRESNVPFGDRTNRSYVLAFGRFDPDGPWRWGFTAERTSDKTLFDRYDIRQPYQDNGLYYGDRRRLISQLYAERQTERSYLSVAAFSIQSLRLDPRFSGSDYRGLDGNKAFETEGVLPLVAPLVDARWEPDGPVLGGRLRLRGSAVSLYRDAYVGAPVLRPEILPFAAGTDGVDSRRVSLQAEWRRVLISPAGLRYEPFVDVRGDAYSIEQLPDFLSDRSAQITRGRATAGLDVSYPLIRRLGPDADLVLEPLIQASISTESDLDPRIPVEDSQTVELDESSLFRTDRLPGYDLYEGGGRITAGARATLTWDQGRSASLFVGRSLRNAPEDAFLAAIPDAPTRTYDPLGLGSDTSDWVVQAEFSPTSNIRGWGHATVDGSGDVRRAEMAVDARWGRRNLADISYIVDQSNPVAGPLNRNYEFVQLAGQQLVYGNWGFTAAGIADLERDVITRSEVGLLFDDDCFRFEIGYRRDNTTVRPTGPSEGVYVRLNLATFGGSGYPADKAW